MNPILEKLGNLIKNNSSRVVAWIGSGLSRPANLPDWTRLMNDLRDLAEAKYKLNSEDKKIRSLIDLASAESDYWLACSHLQNALGQTTSLVPVPSVSQNSTSYLGSQDTPPPAQLRTGYRDAAPVHLPGVPVAGDGHGRAATGSGVGVVGVSGALLS